MQFSRRDLLRNATVSVTAVAATSATARTSERCLYWPDATLASHKHKAADFKHEPAYFVTTTPGFDAHRRTYHWLGQVRKSIGKTFTWPIGSKEYWRGSCILLDRQGHIAMCRHQVETEQRLLRGKSPMEVRFAPVAGADYTPPVSVTLLPHNYALDLAFGQIPAAALPRLGLEPIKWRRHGRLSAGRLAGNDHLAVGFAGGLNLDSYILANPVFQKTAKVNGDDQMACHSQESGIVFRGMSGGAIFARDGIFAGMTKWAQLGDNVDERFGGYLPASALLQAYVELFPAAAAEAGIDAAHLPRLPDPICNFKAKPPVLAIR